MTSRKYSAVPRLAVALAMALAMVSSLLVSAGTVRADGTKVWTGQGATNGVPNTIQCDDANAPGTMVWIFTLGGASNTVTSATLSVNGDTYPGTKIGAEFHFYTPYYDPSTITDAHVDYVGSLGRGTANVVISHACPTIVLGVQKTVNTSYDRTYNWTISKEADNDSLEIPVGQDSVDAHYAVTVDLADPPYTDSNFLVYGTITISNDGLGPAVITGVTDDLPDATVDCGADFPITLASGATLTCDYTAPSDGTDGANSAHVFVQGADPFDVGPLPFSFDDATVTEHDTCVDVTDSYAGDLGTVCKDDTLPAVFTYDRRFTRDDIDECETPQTFDNTATFTTNDNGTQGSDSATVDVTKHCTFGCTLTIGFWKTHAGDTGNNPDLISQYLPIWLGTSGGSKSVEVTSASQAESILSQDGASNGIVKLYAQLLGAKLNIENGADGSAVAATIAAADAFLATHDASDWVSLTSAEQEQVLAWKDALDSYNNGLTGPGHCS
jgi:hypothetical protein